MKSFFTVSLLCFCLATKAQQLPKSTESGILDELKLKKNMPAKPMPQIGEKSIKLFDRNEVLNENLANNSSIFKNNTFSSYLSKKVTNAPMPIVDTKNDNSVIKIWVPDVLKSNMPIVKTYSHW
jgi:hypothetical protein